MLQPVAMGQYEPVYTKSAGTVTQLRFMTASLRIMITNNLCGAGQYEAALPGGRGEGGGGKGEEAANDSDKQHHAGCRAAPDLS